MDEENTIKKDLPPLFLASVLPDIKYKKSQKLIVMVISWKFGSNEVKFGSIICSKDR